MNEQLIEKANQHCKKYGLRYTEPRQKVLEILVKTGRPLGAYEILQALGEIIDNPKPPTVYRAIQFWQKEGFIHCIDSLKAYVACLHGHHIGQAQFLICDTCDYAQELECKVDFGPISTAAKSLNFSISNYTLEIKGRCVNCH
jgi:Fur family zinc uptake transcriptional regulator